MAIASAVPPARSRWCGLRVRGAFRLAPALVLVAVTALPAGEARAQSTDSEIAPWLGWAAGWDWKDGRQRDVTFLHLGLDATGMVSRPGNPIGYGGDLELRMGPWVAFQAPTGRGGSGEGGLTMILTQTEHASYGTFAVRFGGGYGGDHESYFTATLWGGVRYVPARAGQDSGGGFVKATGVRIAATYRKIAAPEPSDVLAFGIEFEPDYFLPPYSLFKWGGKH